VYIVCIWIFGDMEMFMWKCGSIDFLVIVFVIYFWYTYIQYMSTSCGSPVMSQ